MADIASVIFTAKLMFKLVDAPDEVRTPLLIDMVTPAPELIMVKAVALLLT